ncbi:hypothetical protein N7507_000632 [Penicillium longicatenatum]|nr:hypothetical protein N7507_000632 [Penicillium longicatenatum]
MASSPTTHLNPNPIPGQDAPSTSVNLYSRCFKGRKHLFAPSDSSEAQYFVTNPVPYKHRSSWKPIFYRGDNPKYTPTAVAIGMARRSAMWGSFDVQLGEGVQEVLENKKRRKAKRSAVRQAKWRKAFRMRPKPPKEPLEEEQEVVGKVALVRMERVGLFSRTVDFELLGEGYQWTGTRMFGHKGRGVKGWSHDLKLVRKRDHALIAAFEKDRWASFSKSIKTRGPPNKKKTFLGRLQIYYDPHKKLGQTFAQDRTLPEIGDGVNWDGSLVLDMIAFTCWIVVEAEHRLRLKVLDFLEEIAENVEGG